MIIVMTISYVILHIEVLDILLVLSAPSIDIDSHYHFSMYSFKNPVLFRYIINIHFHSQRKNTKKPLVTSFVVTRGGE